MFGLSNHSEQKRTDLEHEMHHARIALARHFGMDAEEADTSDLYSFAEARRRRLEQTLRH